MKNLTYSSPPYVKWGLNSKLLFLSLFQLLLLCNFLLITSTYQSFGQLSCHTSDIQNIVSITEEASPPYYIRIYVHNVEQLKLNGDIKGGQSEEAIRKALCQLYRDFNPLDIYFVWDEDIDDIQFEAAKYLYLSDDIFDINNHEDGIDLYMFGDDVITFGGVASTDKLGIALGGKFFNDKYDEFPQKVINSRIISHEMGHLFGLKHTHAGCEDNNWGETTDPANDCDETGDLFCDTPRDPNMYYDVDPNGCEWGGGIYFDCTPPSNFSLDDYNPDEKNIMAYTHLTCMEYFSGEQQGHMLDIIENAPYLEDALLEIGGDPGIPSDQQSCDCDFPIHHYNDATYDTDQMINGSLYVHNGAEVTISANIQFGSHGKIIVKRGGRLRIDGGELSSACNDSWEGIYVEGNYDIPHTQEMITGALPSDCPSYDQYGNFETVNCWPGVVIINDGLIENARFAIMTRGYRFDEPCKVNNEYFGGLIYAENSTFRNNLKDVAFWKYPHNNLSRFNNCVFERTLPLVDDEYQQHISMWAVNGVTVDGCTFRNKNEDVGDEEAFDSSIYANHTAWRKSEAIYTRNATYSVQNACTFDNYGTAISFDNTDINFSENSLNIIGDTDPNDDTSLQNVFVNNRKGIVGNNVTLNFQFNQVIGDEDYDTESELPQEMYGIWLEGASNYQITDSEFEGYRVGVVAENTEINQSNDNLLLRNTFFSNNVGAMTWGSNEQLLLDCNEFNDSNYDVALISNYDELGSIKAEQKYNVLSSLDEPVRNSFTIDDCGEVHHFWGWHLGGEQTYKSFTYFYPEFGDPELEPTCDENIIYAKEALVSDVDDICNLYDGMTDGPDEDYWEDPTRCVGGVSINCLEDVRSEIATNTAIIENGDAIDLATKIILEPQAFTTYQIFKEASPYLSEAILSDLILSSMDDYLKGDVLIDNSPLSDAAMSLASNHTSDFVYQILYTIKYNESSSAIQLLDIYMRNLSKEKDGILRNLIDQELSNQNYNAARNLPTVNESKAVHYLVNQLIATDQYALAEEVMEDHLSDSSDDQAFRLVHKFNRNIKEEGYCEMDLTPEDENNLLEAANQNTAHAGYARSILKWVADYDFDREVPLPDPSANKQGPVFKEVALLPYQQDLVLSPNPANGEVYIHAWKDVIGGTLKLYDLNGQWISDFDLTQNYLNRINVASMRSGVYIAVLVNQKGANLGSTKLVIVQ